MQATHNVSAEELAKLFYTYRDMLAPDFGLQSSEGSISWEQILPEHRNLMITSASLVLRELGGMTVCADSSRGFCKCGLKAEGVHGRISDAPWIQGGIPAGLLD